MRTATAGAGVTWPDEPARNVAPGDEGDALAGPERILSIGFGFRSAKTLLAAVELGVFDALAESECDGTALAARLGIVRGAADFFDALVAMRLLERDADGRYCNAPEAATYLDSHKPAYVGGHLEYLNQGQYETWNRLADALRQGRAQGGPSGVGGFDAFYADPVAFERFMRGMSAGIVRPARALATRFPWSRYRSVADIGAARGCLVAEILGAHPHLGGIGFDLPRVEPLFAANMQARGIADRARFAAGDFFADALPRADVIVLARVLHDWDVEARKRLLAKAEAAASPGGAVVVVEILIDDGRRDNLPAFLASLNMLLQTANGSEATGAAYAAWLRDAGLPRTEVLALANGYSAVIGFKP